LHVPRGRCERRLESFVDQLFHVLGSGRNERKRRANSDLAGGVIELAEQARFLVEILGLGHLAPSHLQAVAGEGRPTSPSRFFMSRFVNCRVASRDQRLAQARILGRGDLVVEALDQRACPVQLDVILVR
jgi:hypothetical protein